MVETATNLAGKLILIVEDEYALATDLAEFLQDQGATIVGPAGSLKAASGLAEREGAQLSAAVLDINLRNELVYPVADQLIALGVPVVFTTGYDQLLMAEPYSSLPRFPKPIDKAALARVLETLTTDRGAD